MPTVHGDGSRASLPPIKEGGPARSPAQLASFLESIRGRAPHEILGVSRFASDQEITRAYRKRALEYHPDRNQGSPIATQIFAEIQGANEAMKGGCLFGGASPSSVGGRDSFESFLDELSRAYARSSGAEVESTMRWFAGLSTPQRAGRGAVAGAALGVAFGASSGFVLGALCGRGLAHAVASAIDACRGRERVPLEALATAHPWVRAPIAVATGLGLLCGIAVGIPFAVLGAPLGALAAARFELAHPPVGPRGAECPQPAS